MAGELAEYWVVDLVASMVVMKAVLMADEMVGMKAVPMVDLKAYG